MYQYADTWALVLAAGEGSRLRSLTTSPCGTTVPKQFCSLSGGASLLHETLCRANGITSMAQTAVVVAHQHHRWWRPAVRSLLDDNVIVQPENRGTAHGILLPLLRILEQQPDARVVLLPCDHHVSQEGVLTRSLRQAVEQLQWRFDEILLLGLEPEESDPELGYIVPGGSDRRGALTVAQFVEKPTEMQARELIEHGALWNAFIVAASAQALLALFQRRIPEAVAAMRAAIRCDLHSRDFPATTALYRCLPTLDFSRDILQGQEAMLRVLRVPQCGWSDLGTPRRVVDALRHATARSYPPSESAHSGWLSLADSLAVQRERLSLSRTTSPRSLQLS